MRSLLKILSVSAVFIAICSAGILNANAQSRAGRMLKLWLEAEVEDGAETTWKFYLYGAENEGEGEMTCTYGSKKFEGNWQTATDGANTAYVLSFLSNETPVFNASDGNSVPLTSSAIVMTGQLEGDFVIYTLGGETVPFSNTDNGAVRQKYPCELLD